MWSWTLAKFGMLSLGGAVASFACSRLTQDELSNSAFVLVSAPFNGYSISEANAISATVDISGNSISSLRYALGNGNTHGVIDFLNGSINIQRADVSGPCDDSSLIAPACGFTWGSAANGVYHGADYNFFPNALGLSTTFQRLYQVEADVHQQLSTGSLAGGISDCGLDLGFGTAAGHLNAPLASNNLNLPGHSANQDYIKFMHRYKDATENFLIEAPLNFASNGSFPGFGLSVWDSSYNMSKDSIPSTNSDYLDFHLTLTLDHVAKTVTISTIPLNTNKTLSLMHSQTMTWNYQASSTATANGEARGGIEFSNGSNPITMTDFESSRVSVGFLSNGVNRSCGYSNVTLKLFKVPNGP